MRNRAPAWTLAVSFAPAAVVVACGGHIDIGVGRPGELTSDASYQTADCDPSKCANQLPGCALGQPTNVRCVLSSYAGQGPMPAGTCELAFECSASAVDGGPIAEADAGTCSPDECAGQQIVCMSGVASNVRCVPDPLGGSDAGARCVLEGYCPAVDAAADDASTSYDASTSNDASYPNDASASSDVELDTGAGD